MHGNVVGSRDVSNDQEKESFDQRRVLGQGVLFWHGF